jgi:hypothetical protein
MSRNRERTVTVYSVLHDGPGAGAAGDGTHIARFHRKADADAFAQATTCYGRPASADRDDVPARIAARWSIR